MKSPRAVVFSRVLLRVWDALEELRGSQYHQRHHAKLSDLLEATIEEARSLIADDTNED